MFYSFEGKEMEKQYYKFSSLSGKEVVCTYEEAKESAEKLRQIIKRVDDARESAKPKA
jgi:hypothetical protein